MRNSGMSNCTENPQETQSNGQHAAALVSIEQGNTGTDEIKMKFRVGKQIITYTLTPVQR